MVVASLNPFGEEFEHVQKHFLAKFLQVKKKTPYTPSYFLRRDHFPFMAMEKVVERKVQKVPHINFLEMRGTH